MTYREASYASSRCGELTQTMTLASPTLSLPALDDDDPQLVSPARARLLADLPEGPLREGDPRVVGHRHDLLALVRVAHHAPEHELGAVLRLRELRGHALRGDGLGDHPGDDRARHVSLPVSPES